MAVEVETRPRAEPASVEVDSAGGALHVRLGGDWTTETAAAAATRLADIAGAGQRVAFDLRAIDELDTNGALVVHTAAARLGAAGATVEFTGVHDDHERLLRAVAEACSTEPIDEPRPPPSHIAVLERVGRHSYETAVAARDLLNFLGAVTIALVGSLVRPARLRGRALVNHMEHAGLDALPIVGLLSFLIGVVTAYQGADQLARFGAQIYTANLVGLGILREMGVLLTAIIVAGRSGSAFTAQIGTMKVNQEIDALSVIGLDPLEVLVVPRVLALILVMPLLTFYADVLGLVGGAVMATLALNITFEQFANQLQNAVGIGHFFVGMVKAPLFAFIIAVVGCFEGMQVAQSAESVGLRTTKSVVVSIFLIIVVDALLSVFFSLIGV